MILDGHIHMGYTEDFNAAEMRANLLADMKQVGVDGGVVMSINPYYETGGLTARQRIDRLMQLVDGQPELYPAYWIYPMADSALEEVDMALEAGVDAFKIIPFDFYPGEDKAMQVYQKIAQNKKPIIFHAGILWDGHNSAKYNRPAEFECLLEVNGLKFAIAHVAWPWCDECIAVYGKFNNAFGKRPDLSCEMFFDVTPGTPPIWREEVYKKLFCGDYDVMHNVIFGTDCFIGSARYNGKWFTEWMQRDNALYEKFGLAAQPGFLEHIYADNLSRFLGKKDEVIERKIPNVAE